MNDVITSQDKKDEVASASAFSYEVFYRQLGNFLKMLQVMMDSWEDYNSEELAFDIDSLCIKASRLCYMAVQDLALQHTDVTHQRKADNEEYHQQMEKLVIKDYSPFVLRVVNSINEGNMMEGHESPMFASDMSSLFPRLFDILEQSGMSREKMLGFQQMFVSVEPIVKGVFPALQSFEQESFEQESSEQESSEQESFEQESFEQESSELGASEFEPVEFEPSETEEDSEMAGASELEFIRKMWNFMRLFAMTSYLLQHFRRVCQLTERPFTPAELSRLVEQNVQKYMTDEESHHLLDLYFARLKYDNDGKPLSEAQWLEQRRVLKKQVPENLELAFLNYADDASLVGEAILGISFSPEDFVALVDALAKYQLITLRLYEIRHPELQKQELHNEAFNPMVNGKRVDLLELKKTISKMARLVEKKNQWFCVWSVLKHLNVLRENCVFATFARQMMSPEWFGNSAVVHFSADNLSDYSRYFNEFDYTDWDEELFQEKRELYGMAKWSPKLCQNFSQLCEKMMNTILGYSFLQ